MNETACMVGRCATPVGAVVVVEQNRLRLAFSVCLRHEVAIRLRMHVEPSGETTRGLLGLALPSPTEGRVRRVGLPG